MGCGSSSASSAEHYTPQHHQASSTAHDTSAQPAASPSPAASQRPPPSAAPTQSHPAPSPSPAASTRLQVAVPALPAINHVVVDTSVRISDAGQQSAGAVSLSWLREFVSTHQLRPDQTTKQVVVDIITPGTMDTKKAYYMKLPVEKQYATLPGQKHAFFVSHQWQGPFVDLVSTVELYVAQERAAEKACPNIKCPLPPDDRLYLWIDIFAVAQHPGSTQQSDLTMLADALRSSVRGTIMVFGPGGEPLSRIWCLYEIHRSVTLRAEAQAGSQGGREDEFRMLMPSHMDMNKLNFIVNNLDLSRAQASWEPDRLQILADIRSKHVSFYTLMQIVRDAICRSLVRDLKLVYEYELSNSNPNADAQLITHLPSMIDALDACAQAALMNADYGRSLSYHIKLLELAEQKVSDEEWCPDDVIPIRIRLAKCYNALLCPSGAAEQMLRSLSHLAGENGEGWLKGVFDVKNSGYAGYSHSHPVLGEVLFQLAYAYSSSGPSSKDPYSSQEAKDYVAQFESSPEGKGKLLSLYKDTMEEALDCLRDVVSENMMNKYQVYLFQSPHHEHPLLFWSLGRKGLKWRCDVCKETSWKQDDDQMMYTCSQEDCDWDCHRTCHGGKHSNSYPHQPDMKTAVKREDVFDEEPIGGPPSLVVEEDDEATVFNLECHAHPVKLYKSRSKGGNALCNTCNERHAGFVYACRACDWNICPSCFVEKGGVDEEFNEEDEEGNSHAQDNDEWQLESLKQQLFNYNHGLWYSITTLAEALEHHAWQYGNMFQFGQHNDKVMELSLKLRMQALQYLKYVVPDYYPLVTKIKYELARFVDITVLKEFEGVNKATDNMKIDPTQCNLDAGVESEAHVQMSNIALEKNLEVMQLRENYLGPNNDDVVEIYFQIGNNLRRLGRSDEALSYFRRSLAYAARVVGELCLRARVMCFNTPEEFQDPVLTPEQQQLLIDDWQMKIRASFAKNLLTIVTGLTRHHQGRFYAKVLHNPNLDPDDYDPNDFTQPNKRDEDYLALKQMQRISSTLLQAAKLYRFEWHTGSAIPDAFNKFKQSAPCTYGGDSYASLPEGSLLHVTGQQQDMLFIRHFPSSLPAPSDECIGTPPVAPLWEFVTELPGPLYGCAFGSGRKGISSYH